MIFYRNGILKLEKSVFKGSKELLREVEPILIGIYVKEREEYINKCIANAKVFRGTKACDAVIEKAEEDFYDIFKEKAHAIVESSADIGLVTTGQEEVVKLSTDNRFKDVFLKRAMKMCGTNKSLMADVSKANSTASGEVFPVEDAEMEKKAKKKAEENELRSLFFDAFGADVGVMKKEDVKAFAQEKIGLTMAITMKKQDMIRRMLEYARNAEPDGEENEEG